MTDELYTLYRENNDFKEYVDRWCKNRDKSIFEAFNYVLVREYAKYLMEVKR